MNAITPGSGPDTIRETVAVTPIAAGPAGGGGAGDGSPVSLLHPGAELKRAREATGSTVEQISARLNLAVEVICTIEADDYQASVAAAFYRGYLRSYAGLVSLDGDMLVTLYNTQFAGAQATSNIQPSAKIEAQSERAKLWLWPALAVVAVTITSYLVWPKVNPAKPIVPVSTLSTAAAHKPGTTSEPAAGSFGQSTTAVPLTLTAVNTSGAAGDAVASNATKSITTSEPATAVLEFKFIGDCWVRVTDATGEVLALGIKRNGKLMQLEGKPPFKVLLGNARAVILTYAGKRVDLSGYPGGRRAEFTLPLPIHKGESDPQP